MVEVKINILGDVYKGRVINLRCDRPCEFVGLAPIVGDWNYFADIRILGENSLVNTTFELSISESTYKKLMKEIGCESIKR